MEVVAAAVGIADVTARSAHMLWRLCDAWRDAPHDLFQLRDDLSRANEFYGSLKNDVAQYSKVVSSATPTTGQVTEMACEQPGLASDESPPPWSPPDPYGRIHNLSNATALEGKLSTLVELIRTGTRVVDELGSVIGLVLGGRLDGQSCDVISEVASQHGMGSRRRMIWMMKASRVKKLRVEMTNNMLMVSGALVAVTASTTSQLAESVAVLSYRTESHHQDLKHTVLETAGALTTILDATTAENKRTLRRLEDRLEDLHLTSKVIPFLSNSDSVGSRLSPSAKSMDASSPSNSPAALLFCDGTCTCRCHNFRTRTSWTLRGLESTFGYLNISAARLRISNLSCDKWSCSQSGKDGWYMVTYRVPLWLCSTTVRLFCSFSTPSGFDFCVRVSRHLEAGARSSKTSIFYYVHRGDLGGVKGMLASQPWSVLDRLGTYEHTPLSYAAMEGFSEIALLLLQAGADPFYADHYGTSPFDYIFRGWLSDKNSAHSLMQSDLVRPHFFEYLDRYDFSDLQQAIIGTKPLDIPTVMAIPQMAAQANLAITRRMSPLRLAVIKGDAEWVRCLLRIGASPNEPAKSESDSVLLHAAYYGRLDITRALLEAGADVHAKSGADASTALNWAAAFDTEGKEDITASAAAIIDLLVAHGADVNSADSFDRTPLVGCNVTNPEVARRLIRHGANINHQSSSCGNVLVRTIQKGSPETMRMLLEEGADWKFTTLSGGYTILHVLAVYGTAEMIQACREWKMRGLDVSRKDDAGMTPLDHLKNRDDLADDAREEFMRLLDDQSLGLVDKTGGEWASDDEELEFHDAQESYHVKEA